MLSAQPPNTTPRRPTTLSVCPLLSGERVGAVQKTGAKDQADEHGKVSAEGAGMPSCVRARRNADKRTRGGSYEGCSAGGAGGGVRKHMYGRVQDRHFAAKRSAQNASESTIATRLQATSLQMTRYEASRPARPPACATYRGQGRVSSSRGGTAVHSQQPCS